MKFDLVFEGGGAKGMVFVGALQAFEEAGHTVGRLLGTSAGAMMAAFVAAGYNAMEMKAALKEKDSSGQPIFVRFMGTPEQFSNEEINQSTTLQLLKEIDLPLVPGLVEDRADQWLVRTLASRSPNLFALLERGGWYTPSVLLNWMRQKLDDGVYQLPGKMQGQPRRFGHMTLRQFYEATEKDLSVIVSDTTAQQMLVLNHNTTPDVPVAWAVNMSMNLPLFWPEIEWRAKWGSYLGRSITGHKIVDGGVLSNFPIELFISDDRGVTRLMGEAKSDNLIGLMIDERQAVPSAPPPPATPTSTVHWTNLALLNQVSRLIGTALNAHDKRVIEAYEQLVVRLPAKGYGTTEFDMTDARRDALITAGRFIFEEYLNAIPMEGISFGVQPETAPMSTAHANRVAGDMLGLGE